ncbi:shikimate dehydrogenase [Allomuricauda sp. d1]|uniref:shikimate dehydrogenase family protein n=1 Tax=Allomuricauda sp. d1 TaxID=3136725 RepID=UPI0031D4CFC2
MERTEKKENRYGLVGRHISYSFSKGYFTEKFKELGLSGHSYENFDLDDISEFESLIAENTLRGLNVTIPYKEAVIPFLDAVAETAQEIGAVNTIEFSENRCIGHNTDAFGFQKSLEPLLQSHHNKALILGTGGASKAVAHVLESLGIVYTFVSRSVKKDSYDYGQLDKNIMSEHHIIVNCTPLGTHPNIDEKPEIPYQYLDSRHLLYDLIYNPEKTAFLSEGEKRGCMIKNGLEMLQLQAEKSWQIWNS